MGYIHITNKNYSRPYELFSIIAALICSGDRLIWRQIYRRRAAMSTSKTTNFFSWTDDKVQLLLRATQECKAAMAVENVDWESRQSKYDNILPWCREQYPLSKEVMTMGKDLSHKKDEILKGM